MTTDLTIAEFDERARVRRQLHSPTGVVVYTESGTWTCLLAERGNVPIGSGIPIPERVGRRTRRTRIYVAGPDRGHRGAELLASRLRMVGFDVKVGHYAGLPQEAAGCPSAAKNGSLISIEEVIGDG